MMSTPGKPATSFIVVQLGGKSGSWPMQEDVCQGPDHGRMALWILDHPRHLTMRFQTSRGPIDIKNIFLTPENGSGDAWMVYGELVNQPGDTVLYVRVYYDLRTHKGKIHYHPRPFLILRPDVEA